MTRTKKGSIFLSMIMLLVVYLFAVAIVVVFFYFFKFHIITTILDEYRWNKVQEVPLDLFSMDVNGESFVSRMNKIYYGFIDMEPTKIKLRDIIHKQLFYSYTGTKYPYEYFITIGNLSFTGQSDCTCNGKMFAHFTGAWSCSEGCGEYEHKSCAKVWARIPPFGSPIYVPDSSKCFGKTGVIYSEVYPFPLAFNGTNDLITIISYEVTEWRE